MRAPPLLLLFFANALACSSTPRLLEPAQPSAPRARAVALGPTASVDANWKERLEQPYVFLEHVGDYRRLGETMALLEAQAEARGLPPDGPPFALFYDDPGLVDIDRLRARVCCPVVERPSGTDALQFDLLPRAMVVYARVEGAWTDVAEAYPALFAYLCELGWSQGGPVREVYLASPRGTGVVTEIQIPWAARAE